MREYRSVFAPLIARYIEFKRGLGYSFQEESAFAEFDRFCLKHGITESCLTQDFCDKWNEARPNEAPGTRSNRLNDVRNFLIYIVNLGYETCIPKIINTGKSTFTPYIFTDGEIARFFAACDNNKITVRSVANHAYPAVFRLLYGCGLRLNEALSLKCGDVDLTERFVIIREPKNQCERKLPLSDSLAEILLEYKSIYAQNYGDNDYFFQNKRGGKMTGRTAYHWFRIILREAGISHGGRGSGPRIHDFRHTFSVHSMSRMSESGLDLYYSLPILSEYLGHKSIEATDGYVRLTAQMFPDIIGKADEVCGFVYPEVYSQ